MADDALRDRVARALHDFDVSGESCDCGDEVEGYYVDAAVAAVAAVLQHQPGHGELAAILDPQAFATTPKDVHQDWMQALRQQQAGQGAEELLSRYHLIPKGDNGNG